MISRTLSTNSGSLDSLKVALRCGGNPKAFHIRRIVVCEKPVTAAMDRIDQCVASAGVVQRSLDHSSNLIVADRARPAGARFIEQPVKTIGQEAPAPLTHRVLVNAKLGRHDLALQPVGAAQNNPTSF
jgi:hypothetical protein